MPYRLSRRRPVVDTVRAAGDDLLGRAEDRLSADRPSAAEIHQTRVSVKRVRALLTLIADIDDDATESLDHRLRDANRALSARRDASVLLDTWRDLAERAAVRTFADFNAARPLLNDVVRQSGRDFISLDILARELAEARRAWNQLPFVADGWSALADRVAHTYRRGRKQLGRLSPESEAEEFHELRKRGKLLQYQIEFLQPMQPDRWGALHEDVKKLTDKLGRHHDLEVLADRLTAEFPETPSRRRILNALRSRQASLARKSLRHGEEIYDEKPARLLRHLQHDWAAWHKPIAVAK
ncbi:MAG TPA: CHAD domain-containing protein [Planctomycetaceae bacterium]|nr:CHAD domain-containing protein [Planctomycetaceae bacterium]